MQHRVFVAHLGEPIERGRHGGVGLGAERRVVELHLLHGAAPVIGAVVHVDDFEPVLEQGNRGQDAVAVQAVGVELIGLEI